MRTNAVESRIRCGLVGTLVVACLAVGPVKDSLAAPATADGAWHVVRQAVPTGRRDTSVLLIEQSVPREVAQGRPFDYRISVSNLTDCVVSDLGIEQILPLGVTLTASYPRATVGAGRRVRWRLGELPVGGSQTIHARATADTVGGLTFCCDADYRLPVCATVQSTRPELALSLDVAPEVTRCDDIPVRLTVTNAGTGTCSNVQMRYDVPEGVTAQDGRRQLAFRIPSLPPGATRQAAFRLRPVTVGRIPHRALATSGEGLRAEAVSDTLIVEPRLTVIQTGTDRQFAGRNVTYTFTVTNDGDASATNVVVQDVVPQGVEVVRSTPADSARTDGSVVWRLPRLAAGETQEFSITVRSPVAGTFTNRVTATADCAEEAGATHESVVEGIAAILLEVIDRDDPIEVGGQETYVITATNQGSAVGTNLQICCELEENMDCQSSDGPTTATVAGNVITFAPLPRLAPKEKAVWTVTCGALTAGDVRFKVSLTSDQLSRPVQETEATHLY